MVLVEPDIDKIDDLAVKNPVDEIPHRPSPNEPQSQPRDLPFVRDKALVGVYDQSGPDRDQDEKRNPENRLGFRHESKGRAGVLDIT